MSGIYQILLKQLEKSGLSLILLIIGIVVVWDMMGTQTLKFERKAIEYEARIKEVETGLFDCEKARSSLAQKVTSLEEKITTLASMRRR